jgi:hypothetical protein
VSSNDNQLLQGQRHDVLVAHLDVLAEMQLVAAVHDLGTGGHPHEVQSIRAAGTFLYFGMSEGSSSGPRLAGPECRRPGSK